MNAGSGLSMEGAGQPPKPLVPAQGPGSAGSFVCPRSGSNQQDGTSGRKSNSRLPAECGCGLLSPAGRLQLLSLGSIRRRGKLRQGTIVPLVNQALGFSNQWF